MIPTALLGGQQWGSHHILEINSNHTKDHTKGSRNHTKGHTKKSRNAGNHCNGFPDEYPSVLLPPSRGDTQELHCLWERHLRRWYHIQHIQTSGTWAFAPRRRTQGRTLGSHC